MKTKLTTHKKLIIYFLPRKRLIYFICIMVLSTIFVSIFNLLARSSEVTDLTVESELFFAQGLKNSKENEDKITQIVLNYLNSVSGGAKPSVTQVVIVDNYALADWTLGNSGGTALLTKKSGKWNFVIPGGGAIDSNELQNSYHAPKKTADELVQLQLRCYKYPSSCNGH